MNNKNPISNNISHKPIIRNSKVTMERILSDLDLSKHQGKMQEKQITLDTFEYLVTQERETRNKLNSERINNHQNKMHQLFPTSRSIHQSAVDNLNQLKEMV